MSDKDIDNAAYGNKIKESGKFGYRSVWKTGIASGQKKREKINGTNRPSI